MSLKRKQPATDTADNETLAEVYRSSPVEDRDSTFIGLFSPTLKPKELQNLPEIRNASHKILGWRRESNQQSINKSVQFVTGSDDDGEKYGGKRIEKVLDACRVSGACVVARWYGGTMLGPVRFTHMETCATAAIRQWQDHEMQKQAKKRKLEEEEADRKELSLSLAERDKNILVLRALAVEKEEQIKLAREEESGEPSENASAASTASPATAPIDYATLPLTRLKALDKARDATVAFLLKRIDKAEEELRALKT